MVYLDYFVIGILTILLAGALFATWVSYVRWSDYVDRIRNHPGWVPRDPHFDNMVCFATLSILVAVIIVSYVLLSDGLA